MVGDAMSFDSYEKIHKAIAAVNSACYPKIKENTFFLEQVTEKNMVKVMQEIRDAYDHLHTIYTLKDPFSEKSQALIVSEYEKYRGHMQRLAIETVRKVAEYYISLIRDFLTKNIGDGEWKIVSVQIAQRVKVARDREASPAFSKRYQAWQEILDFTTVVGEKYGIFPGDGK